MSPLWKMAASALLLAACSCGREPAPDDAVAGGLRIVSLAPSTTEMVFALGLEKQLVGVTDACDYPPAAKGVARVGSFGKPNLEALLAARPDLVLATDFAKKDIPQAIEQAGIQLLELELESFEQLFAAFRAIGEAAGAAEQADQVVEHMEAALAEAAARYRDVPAARRPRVYAEVWHDPVLTPGGTSFLDDVIARAGGVNVAHALEQPYAPVNPEQVIAWDPDAILVCYMTPGRDVAKQIASRIGWADIAAVRTGRIIHDIHPDLLLRPGPRLVEGVTALAERLYPPADTRR